MITIENNQVYSTEGKMVHRIGEDIYFHRATVLTGETAEVFEEIEEAPRMTRHEYESKVAELIRRRYSTTAETALINNYLDPNHTEAQVSEYMEYQAYRRDCKAKAKTDLFREHR
ncbi:MAG: hypothetical protein J6C44_06590 [Muribaculaceae bacterium]|nr:hypothetical protein [Muribaculaceae bacterium]MBO5187433.1 hypothetical protein [Prevotella sp.]